MHLLILRMLLLLALVLALFLLLEWKLSLVQVLEVLEVLLASKLLLKLVPIQAQVLVLIRFLALVAPQSHFRKHLDPGFPSKILGLTTQFILPLALILYFPAIRVTD